jgi:hypothetical protein
MPGIGSGAGAVSRRLEKETFMFKLFSPLAIASALVFLPCASPAEALSAVTFVSGKGTNAGTCASPATPCRTFQFAVNQTSPGGEVKALDPANYSGVTITKAISIEGVDGASIAGIALNGVGISISAGPKDVINISNITINGGNAGQAGVQAFNSNSFGSLTFTHCTIQNFRGDGIDILAGSGKVFLIADVVVSDNAGLGLELVGVPGTLDHVTVIHNGGSIRAAQGAAVVSLINSTVANNSASIDSDDGATIRLFLSFIPGGVELTGGTALSAGNNFIPPTGLTEVGTH